MSDMITAEEAGKLLDGTTPGPWRAEGEPWNRIVWSSAENRVCFMAHSNGLDDDRDIATSNLVAAAPDLARTVIALHAQLADAKAAQALVVERAAKAIREEAKVSPYQNGMTVVYQRGLSDGFEAAAQVVDALADPSGVEALAALRAERDEAKRLMQARHREMLAADDLMRKHQRRAEKLESDRDRLAAANAALEAQVARLVGAGEVCDRVLHFDLRKMIVFGDDYNQAVKDAADAIRAALAEVQADARREGGE